MEIDCAVSLGSDYFFLPPQNSSIVIQHKKPYLPIQKFQKMALQVLPFALWYRYVSSNHLLKLLATTQVYNSKTSSRVTQCTNKLKCEFGFCCRSTFTASSFAKRFVVEKIAFTSICTFWRSRCPGRRRPRACPAKQRPQMADAALNCRSLSLSVAKFCPVSGLGWHCGFCPFEWRGCDLRCLLRCHRICLFLRVIRISLEVLDYFLNLWTFKIDRSKNHGKEKDRWTNLRILSSGMFVMV